MKHPINCETENHPVKTRNNWKRVSIFFVLGLGCLLSTDCAQFTAMKQPKPFKPTAAVVGANRGEVTAELGTPVDSEEQNGRLTETYKYTDGGSKNHGASKTARVILYTAGDFFTIFLDQILTWPIETYGFAGTPHVVTVTYAKSDDGLWRVKDIKDVEPENKEMASRSRETTAETPPKTP